MSAWKKYLQEIYFIPSNPASFSGPDKLYNYVQEEGKYKISKYKIRKWLQSQEPYSLQRPFRRPQNRTEIVVAGIDDQWSADLMDMVKFSKHNKEYKYVLVVIDVFSKYLWLRKLKDKKGESVATAFQDIFKTGRVPNRIRTDMGQEFKAKRVQTVFKKEEINHLYALNEVKASVSARVIKTIKAKIYRYFSYNQSYRYIDKLQSFADGYNHTIHSTIDMAPIEVKKENAETVRLSKYFSRPHSGKLKKIYHFRFKLGDRVRLTYLRNIFSREYDKKWTGEVFTISGRFWRSMTPLYRIKDYHGDEISGSYYQSELQQINVKNNSLWKIEKVLKTKGRGPYKQYYIKWLNWPTKFNSWVKASDVKDF
ncbi:Hypothetical predicted protein [Mytilus galloprovincialis]|uniref:Integrase catalytic domain-containing protein n=1 Tax=Mytilus galloprovincialis TaxID=29158 RepID=A0A8B6HR98_MYTGA|nr:Hypothetical predicted protein [Mytilus galloprovincialis]